MLCVASTPKANGFMNLNKENRKNVDFSFLRQDDKVVFVNLNKENRKIMKMKKAGIRKEQIIRWFESQ